MFNQVFDSPEGAHSALHGWKYSASYTPGLGTYSLVAFVNTTSPMITPVMGSYAHQAILRDFFSKPSLNLQITFDPYNQKKETDPN